MGIANAFQLNSIYIDTVALEAKTIDGIVGKVVNTGTEVVTEGNPTELYPELSYVNASAPSAALTCMNLTTAIDNLGLRGICITSDVSNPGVSLYARALACSAPVAVGTASHVEYLFKKGLMVPQSLSCDHRGNAALTIAILGIYDGTNAPLIVNTSVAILAADTATSRFTLGAVKVANNVIAQKRNVTIDFGNNIYVDSSDSDQYPTFASIQQTNPRITIRCLEGAVNWGYAGGLAGVACTHAQDYVYFAKRATAPATLEHLQITYAGTAAVQTVFDAQGNATGESDIMIDCTYDGSNAPLVFDTTAALP